MLSCGEPFQTVLFCAVLCFTHAGALQVSAEERERAKRVVYGIVYGQTPFGLAQSLADQGISTKAAEAMIDSFLARFPGQYPPACRTMHGCYLRSSHERQAGVRASTVLHSAAWHEA